ncbi:MAG: hypothetical protein ACRDOZ_11125 [Nocardioides sp.]
MRERVALGAVVLPFLLLPFLAGTAAAPPPEEGRVVFRFQDPAIVEASGLVVQDGLFLTTNDSGDTGRVFAVDPDTGRTIGVTTWASEPQDVEALAPAGAGEVWVGDIGDNLEERDSIRVTSVPVGAGDRDESGTSYDLVFPGPPRDAESLLSHPETGRVFVATKEIFGAALFAAPAELSPDQPNRLRRVGPTLTFATDGAFFPDGKHLIIRNYDAADVYTFPGLERVAGVALPDQQQGEAIAVSADDRVFVTSEGRRQAVLEVSLPESVRERMAPPAEQPAAAATTPTPKPRNELPEQTAQPSRDPWQWVLGAGLFVIAVVMMLLAVRPNVRHPSG